MRDVEHASGCDSENVCDVQVEDEHSSSSPPVRSASAVEVEVMNVEIEGTSVHPPQSRSIDDAGATAAQARHSNIASFFSR